MAPSMSYQSNLSPSDQDNLALPTYFSSSSYSSEPQTWNEDAKLQMAQQDQGPLYDLLYPDGIEVLAEKHTLETDESHDHKRQEITQSGEGEKKKPGRKPILNEPTTKRKAQNRAAQRAFRERKESHVKELEARVAQLEEQNNSKSVENAFLKAQLAKIRSASQDFSFPDEGAFTFAVPPPITHQNSQHGSSTSPSVHSKDSPSSMRNSSDCPSLSTGNSPLSTSDNDFNAASMPLFGRSFSIPESQSSFGQYSTGTSDYLDTKPKYKDTNIQENALFFNNIASPSKDLNFDGFNPMDYRDNTLNNFDLDPLFDGVGAFDFEPEFPDFTFQTSAATAADLEPAILTAPDTQQQDARVNAVKTAAGKDDMGGCDEAWRKVVAHPKFDTFDIDDLCQKMKDKARCTQSAMHPSNWGQADNWARFDRMLDEYAEQQSIKNVN